MVTIYFLINPAPDFIYFFFYQHKRGLLLNWCHNFLFGHEAESLIYIYGCFPSIVFLTGVNFACSCYFHSLCIILPPIHTCTQPHAHRQEMGLLMDTSRCSQAIQQILLAFMGKVPWNILWSSFVKIFLQNSFHWGLSPQPQHLSYKKKVFNVFNAGKRKKQELPKSFVLSHPLFHLTCFHPGS